jgi:hypothetical protein
VLLAKGTTQDLPALGPFEYEMSSRKGGPRSLEVFAGPALSGPNFGGPDHLDGLAARFGWAPGVRIGGAYKFEDWRLRLHLEYIQSFVDLPGERIGVLEHIGFRSFSSVAAGLLTVLKAPVVLEVGPELGYTRCLGEFRKFDHCYRPQDATLGLGIALSVPMGPFKVGVELDAALFHLSPTAVYPGVNMAVVGSYAF